MCLVLCIFLCKSPSAQYIHKCPDYLMSLSVFPPGSVSTMSSPLYLPSFFIEPCNQNFELQIISITDLLPHSQCTYPHYCLIRLLFMSIHIFIIGGVTYLPSCSYDGWSVGRSVGWLVCQNSLKRHGSYTSMLFSLYLPFR